MGVGATLAVRVSVVATLVLMELEWPMVMLGGTFKYEEDKDGVNSHSVVVCTWQGRKGVRAQKGRE